MCVCVFKQKWRSPSFREKNEFSFRFGESEGTEDIQVEAEADNLELGLET